MKVTRGIHIIRHLTKERTPMPCLGWPRLAERLWAWDVALGLKTWDGIEQGWRQWWEEE